MNSERRLAAGAVAAGCYTALQLLSNIASLNVGVIAGAAVDMGAFCYPLTFTLRDAAHRALGVRAVTRLVFASAAVCLFSAAYLMLCARVAVPAGHEESGRAFAAVFSPVWRIVAASIAAMLAGELADTAVFQAFVKRGRGPVWLRSVCSNAVSVPVDSIVFSAGAFAGTLPNGAVAQIFLFNLVVKFAVSLAGLPLLYTVNDGDGHAFLKR